MKCKKCDYKTDNKKSFSNHSRYGCHGFELNKICLYCGKIIIKRLKPKEQGKFCDRLCYSLWRSVNCIGEKASNYKDGKCKDRQLLRARLQFKQWRKSVFRRDGYTCQKCGNNKGGNLETHHIKSFALFPEFRFDIKNGITLCKKCHERSKNYGYTKQNSKRNKIQSVE